MRYSGEEPRLEDILADPIVRILMRRDAVGEQGLRQVIAEARGRLGHFTNDAEAVLGLAPAMIPHRCGFQSGIPSR